MFVAICRYVCVCMKYASMSGFMLVFMFEPCNKTGSRSGYRSMCSYSKHCSCDSKHAKEKGNMRYSIAMQE